MGSNPIRVVVIISQMITCWKQLTIIYGVLAQLGEHLPYKQRVTGSSPTRGAVRIIMIVKQVGHVVLLVQY